MMRCRLIVDPPLPGPRNMAVDEHLLEAAAGDGVAALRFYQWTEPTLSLGYFQAYCERDRHAASREAAVVRRISGGGALVHDGELTYCLCLPAEHELSRRTRDVYKLVHAALIDALGEFGVSAQLYSSSDCDNVENRGRAEPFLCFDRRTSFDVVVAAQSGAGAKIAGSAQRRRRGALLQHGAVLAAKSSRAPTLPGIREASGRPLEIRALVAPWSRRLEQSLDLQLFDDVDEAASEAAHIAPLEGRHASNAWLKRR